MARIPNQDVAPADAEAPKPKRDFEVADDKALYDKYPQFFKLVPDYAKIRQAMKLGISMPGIELMPHHPDYEEKVTPASLNSRFPRSSPLTVELLHNTVNQQGDQ